MLDFITIPKVKMGSALDIGHYKHSFGSLVSGFELTKKSPDSLSSLSPSWKTGLSLFPFRALSGFARTPLPLQSFHFFNRIIGSYGATVDRSQSATESPSGLTRIDR